MSFKFWMYRARPGLAPVTQWSEMQAEDLGPQSEVCRTISDLLGSVRWLARGDKLTSGEAVDSRYDCGYRLALHEDDTGSVRFITATNHASPYTLSLIMDHFALNYCCTDFGDFRQPHACDDNWTARSS